MIFKRRIFSLVIVAETVEGKNFDAELNGEFCNDLQSAYGILVT